MNPGVKPGALRPEIWALADQFDHLATGKFELLSVGKIQITAEIRGES
jgi:hypothetical protein